MDFQPPEYPLRAPLYPHHPPPLHPHPADLSAINKRPRDIDADGSTSIVASVDDTLERPLKKHKGEDSKITDSQVPESVTITSNGPNGILADIIEDALPLSPTDSCPDIISPVPGVHSDILGRNDVGSGVVGSQGQIVGELATLASENLLERSYRELTFRLLGNLNRRDLSDVATLIRDHLKRDFVSSLPFEIAIQLLVLLPFSSIQNCLGVSKRWHSLLWQSIVLWKQLLITEGFTNKASFDNFIDSFENLSPNCKSPLEKYRASFLYSSRILGNWYNPHFKPKRTTLKGHLTSVITCLQFEDGYVITGADDKMIRVYSIAEKKFVEQLQGHDGGVWTLKYDSSGLLVSGSTDRAVGIWDVERGICTHIFKGHSSTVRCLDIVQYKGVKYIVTGSRDNTLHVWKLPEKKHKNKNKNKNGTDIDDSDDTDPSPIVYHTPEENPYFVGVLRGHIASVRTVSGYGNIVVSGSYDNTLIVWDIAKMKCLYVLTGHADRIYSTIYDHIRKRCISASMDSTIRVWDLDNIWNNGECISSPVAATGDNNNTNADNTDNIDNNTGDNNTNNTPIKIVGSMHTLQGHTALVGLLRLSDKYLVSAAADGTIRGWDAQNYSRKFAYHHMNLSAITTFYVDDNILVSGSEGQFNVYNLRNGEVVHSDLLNDADHIWSVNFRGGMLVAAVEKGGQSYLEILDFSGGCGKSDGVGSKRIEYDVI